MIAKKYPKPMTKTSDIFLSRPDRSKPLTI